MSKKDIFILTGANGQIGKAITKAIIKKKQHVFAIDLDEDKSDNFSSEYYSFVKLNVCKTNDVKKAFANIFKLTKQNNSIHLINNAGVATFMDFKKRSGKDFNHVVDVNLKGTFNTIRQFSYESEKINNINNNNSIVNIGSIFGIISPDFSNYVDLNGILIPKLF